MMDWIKGIGIIIGAVSAFLLAVLGVCSICSSFQCPIYNQRYGTHYTVWDYMWVTPAPVTITKESK